MKFSVKRLYRKHESIWEYDEPDTHGNHRRKLYKFGRRKMRRVLHRIANKEINEQI